jgi:biotin synthase
MNSKQFMNLAEKIIDGYLPDIEEYRTIVSTPDNRVFHIVAGADLLRDTYLGRSIHLCTICNGKSGRCTEDCAFCSQSRISKANSPIYPLLSKYELKQGALAAYNSTINRYSIVTSGKRLSRNEVMRVADAISDLDQNALDYCVSLGTLDQVDFEILKEAGISRYHHNLETSRSNFKEICSTHNYDDRIETIHSAKSAGLSVCAGGIFGIGEIDEQILELALTLKELDVDAIPINFLTPIKGTPLEKANNLTPLRCLKIIALFRYVLPKKEIIVCGGRENNLRNLHPMVFYAGASGVMTGNYLTTKGRSLQDDLEMLAELKLRVRE